jgi:Ca2+-binding RTX toxin-like protein
MTGWKQDDVDLAAASADSGAVDIFSISIGTDADTIREFELLAVNNRGLAFQAPSSAEVVDAILAAVDAASYSKPTIQSLVTTAPLIGTGIEGEAVYLSGSFTDVDLMDSFNATVAWGDGSVANASITQLGDQYAIAANYVYPRGGKYKVEVTLVDSAGYLVRAKANAFVTGANAVGGRLNVVGTAGTDEVNVYPGAGGVFVHADFLAEEARWFPASEVLSLGVYLGDGDDSVVVAASLQLPSRLVGGDGHDGLYGGSGRDRISGGDGNDFIRGFDGDDFLEGNMGHDQLYGHLGNDILKGGNGDDFLYGGAGLDQLRGGNGIDHLYGDEHADLLHGGNENDYLYGGDGDDHLTGGAGDDQAWGQNGDDQLLGSSGMDQLFGGWGADVLSGEAGDDELDGGEGWDILYGGSGNDQLVNGEVNFP